LEGRTFEGLKIPRWEKHPSGGREEPFVHISSVRRTPNLARDFQSLESIPIPLTNLFPTSNNRYMRYTRDAAEILDMEFGGDPAYQELRVQERANSQAARAIYDARQLAGLTQSQLARLAGTTQSVVSRLEDGDYDRHGASGSGAAVCCIRL